MLRDRRTLFAAALVGMAAMCWGTWPAVLYSVALAPLQVALIVQLVQALPAPLMAWRDRAGFGDRGAVRALLLLAVLDAAQCVLYFPALARGPVAVAALTHYLGPVLVALAAPFVPGERTSRRAMAAAPLSLLGLLLVMGPPRTAPVTTALLGGASAFFGAASLFAVRRAVRSFSPVAVGSLHAVLSAGLILAVFGRGVLPPLGAGTLRVALAAVVLGIGASALFVQAVKRVPAAIASTITYVEPVTAAGIGALLLGERLGLMALVGAAVVIGAGVWTALEPAPTGQVISPASGAGERRAA